MTTATKERPTKEPAPVEQLTLAQKLAAVAGEISWVEKSEKNTQQNYNYAPVGAIYAHVRPLLAKHGITVIVRPMRCKQELAQTRSGGSMTKTTMKLEFTLTDGHESLVIPWYTEAQDSLDKGINKAMTNAMKYFLLTTFMVSTGEDPDAHEVPERAAPAKAQQAKKPTNSRAQAPQQDAGPERLTRSQATAIVILLKEAGFDEKDEKKKLEGREFIGWLAGVESLSSVKDLSKEQATKILDSLGSGENGDYRSDKKKVEDALQDFYAETGSRRVGDIPPIDEDDVPEGIPF